MSERDDHPGEMRRDPGLDEQLAEDILRGRAGDVPDEYHSLAEAVAAIRDTASTTPEPSAAMRHVFEHGIRRDPEDAPEPSRGSRLRRLVPRAAGLGLALKVALAGAAAAAVAGGAGAAGVLPGQDGPATFLPWLHGERDTVEAPADETPSERAELGREVADEVGDDDARVDGPSVAERARELGEEPFAGHPARGSAGQAREDGRAEPTDGRERAEEASEHGRSTADQRRPGAPPSDAPTGTADEAREERQPAPGGGSQAGRSDGAGAASDEPDPSSRTPRDDVGHSGGTDASDRARQEAGPPGDADVVDRAGELPERGR